MDFFKDMTRSQNLTETLKKYEVILPSNQTFFPLVNQENTVIMGKNTWESLPLSFRPLPYRQNKVLTQTLKDLQITKLQELPTNFKIIDSYHWVIGGAQVYQTTIKNPKCEWLFLTHIQKAFDCDVFFPKIPNHFKKVSNSPTFYQGILPFYFAVYHNNQFK